MGDLGVILGIPLVILWGNRVVIPENMRAYLSEELHKNHDGIVISKALARSYFWWPAIDKDIEQLVKNCPICSENRNMPPKVTHNWLKPERPWSRLHIDYAGPFQGKTFLILIDAFSKWPEGKIVNDMSSTTLIRVLRDFFCEQGLPDTIVSDNGRSFVSEEFKAYLKQNDIKQILIAPYHPASNGQAERTVQTIKNKLRKHSSEPWHIRLPLILYGLRTTPNSVNEKSPAELLNNRWFRTKLDNLNPLSFKTNKEELKTWDKSNRLRTFNVGQSVYVRNYAKGPRWLKGIVDKRIGLCPYLVSWNNRLLMRHINQMHSAGVEKKVPKISSAEEHDSDDEIVIPSPHKWADMIGVTGAEDITFHKDAGDIGVSRKKRMLSLSPPSLDIHKRSRCHQESSFDSSGKEVTDSEE